MTPQTYQNHVPVVVLGGGAEAMTFAQMLKEVRGDMQQSALAKALGYSPQHLCDLENGRRMPSVELVNRICEWMGRGPKGRREWHLAGARAHGWDV